MRIMANNENDWEKICRTCLRKNENMKPIFNINISDSMSVRMVDFIRRMTSIKMVKGDGLPEHLCLGCIETIFKAFNFTQVCISSDSRLRLQLMENKQSEVVQTENGFQNAQIVHESKNVDSFSGKDELVELLHRDVLEIVHEQDDKIEVKIEIENSPSEYIKVQKSYDQEFKCEDCHKSFSVKEKLEKHMQVHDTNNQHKCSECSRSFPLKKQLSVHMRSHVKLEDKQYVCDVCGLSFLYFYLLNQHKFKHSIDKPFPCLKCNRGCVTAESLRRHMKTHEENYERKKHTCTVCLKEFLYPSFLAEHMKNHTGEKPFLCSFCGRGFRQRGALDCHIRSHTGLKPYICPNCNGRFSSKGVLKIHMRRYTNERPYVCDICGKAFARSSDLKSHHRLHTGRKEFLCTVCEKYMSSKGQLTVHLRTHTGEKPFSCDICQKAFSTRTMLVKHIRIHTGERPYVCKICSRAFNQSSTLKTHEATHQKKIKEEVSDTFINTIQEEIILYEYN